MSKRDGYSWSFVWNMSIPKRSGEWPTAPVPLGPFYSRIFEAGNSSATSVMFFHRRLGMKLRRNSAVGYGYGIVEALPGIGH